MGYSVRATLRRLGERVYAGVLTPSRYGAYHIVNRRLGITNRVVAEDTDIQLDVDPPPRVPTTRACSVSSQAGYWGPADPANPLTASRPLVSALTHPRQRRVARWTSAFDDLGRVLEALRFDLSRKRDRRTRSDRLL